MRVVSITKPGGPEVLAITQRPPPPEPTAGQVRVRVRACGLNRADTLQRRGLYPAPPGVASDVPGLEFAGEVVGDGGGWCDLDRVMGITSGGAMAEEIVVWGDQLMPVPESVSYEAAAAFPEAYLTAYDALIRQGDLVLGEVVLVHAVASGVGLAALQIANLCGARVVGTSRSAEKLERCRPLGLTHAIDASDGFDPKALQSLRLRPQLILDLVGAKYLAANVQAIDTKGVIVVVGLVGGIRAELDLALLLRKRATLIGTVLRARSPSEKAESARANPSSSRCTRPGRSSPTSTRCCRWTRSPTRTPPWTEARPSARPY